MARFFTEVDMILFAKNYTADETALKVYCAENSVLDHDSIVTATVESFLERSKVGNIKYGTNLDRTDLSFEDWLKHAREEAQDFVVYLRRIEKDLNEIGSRRNKEKD